MKNLENKWTYDGASLKSLLSPLLIYYRPDIDK
jgi:hypothetical protein